MTRNEGPMLGKPDALVRHEIEPVCDYRAPRLSRRDPQGESAWWPELEMVESDHRLVARLALQGIAKHDLSVFVDDGGLVVEGERECEIEEKGDDECAAELTHAKFRRPIPLTDGVRPEDVKATLRAGVLELTLPFPATAAARQPRKVAITVGLDQTGA